MAGGILAHFMRSAMPARLDAFRESAAWQVLRLTLLVQAIVVFLYAVNTATAELAFFALKGSEVTLANVVSSMLLIAAAATSWWVARAGGRGRPAWALIAAIMLLFAIDSIFGLHDRVETLGGPFLESLTLALEPIAGVVLVLLLVRSIRTLSPPAPALLLAAGLSLIVSQGAEAMADIGHLQRLLLHGVERAQRDLLIVVEEWGEMLIPSFVLAAAAAPLRAARRDRHGDPTVDDAPRPVPGRRSADSELV